MGVLISAFLSPPYVWGEEGRGRGGGGGKGGRVVFSFLLSRKKGERGGIATSSYYR